MMLHAQKALELGAVLMERAQVSVEMLRLMTFVPEV